MMKTTKIWDKLEPINGVEAKEVITSQRIKDNEEIFLVLIGDRVTEIQHKDIIISNHNLDASLTCEEVAQKYLEIKAQEELNVENDNIAKEKQQDEINNLKKQNVDLENALVELASMIGGA